METWILLCFVIVMLGYAGRHIIIIEINNAFKYMLRTPTMRGVYDCTEEDIQYIIFNMLSLGNN